MRALITGASSGIGLEFAKSLSKLGYDLILVARRKEKLEEISKKIKTKVEVFTLDLSVEENVFKLHEETKGRVDLLINNAGFGVYGEFISTNLAEELEMINVNIKAYHILTKLFLIDMVKRNDGRILNVVSAAAFHPGALVSAYNSTKAYIYSLSASIYEELRSVKSNVKINILCPGPVNTEFNKRAKVEFNMSALEANYVVNYAIRKMLKNKLIIIPGKFIKVVLFLSKLLPVKLVLKIYHKVQKKKAKKMTD